jgi:type VI protein secretion system component Hcp
MITKRTLGILAAAALAAAPAAGRAQGTPAKASAARPAAAVGSIRITGLPGETAGDKSKQIEIVSWSFGVAGPGSRSTAGAGAEVLVTAGACGAAPGSFSFVKAADKASAAIQNAALAQTALPSIRMETRTEKYQFWDAYIESYKPAPSLSGGARSKPAQETVTIRFRRCERVP